MANEKKMKKKNREKKKLSLERMKMEEERERTWADLSNGKEMGDQKNRKVTVWVAGGGDGASRMTRRSARSTVGQIWYGRERREGGQ